MSAALLAGVDKMKKPELMEMCTKYKIEPMPRSVGDMKYKLKRLLEDADAPDAKKAKPAAAAVTFAHAALHGGAVRRDVDGDVCYPRGPDGRRFIVHLVVQAADPKWSARGVMGQISRAFGTEPQVQYEALGHTLKLGQVQYVDVTAGKTIASVFCLGKPAGGAPPFLGTAFAEGLRDVGRKAKAAGATVHIHRPVPPHPGMNWAEVEACIDDALVTQGVDTWVYTPAPRAAGAAPAAAAADAAPAATPTTPVSATVDTARAESVAKLTEGKTLDDFPLESCKPAKLHPIPRDCQEFWDLETRFYANVQGRNEDYVADRIKKGLRPLKFTLVGAQRVENTTLEARFEIRRRMIEAERKQKQRARVSFHATHPKNISTICTTSLLRFKHPLNPCKKQVDDGYFGSNRKGVYVSRYADYTLKYANNVVPLEPKETVKTIMFKTLPGKSRHFPKMPGAIDPTPGYDSHSSPTYMEWYLFDESQLCPEYICEVRADEDTRTKSDDE
eukprot:TRINITY_DN50510_c0_g1_i1.p1 TRINITY_DN50510_c0_g1~~TRINITY_DN50510_c0_g1_i1.p1  ORF type:complete len:529 (+),score=185.96 TRINITY_DN50510_c0_g1_i1:84-1589(+)